MYSHQASDSQQSHHVVRAALVQRRKLTPHAAPLQDNRSSQAAQLQANVLQLASGANAYKAGKGAYWHIHYDHVKFGGLAETRINFNSQKKKKTSGVHLALHWTWIKTMTKKMMPQRNRKAGTQ